MKIDIYAELMRIIDLNRDGSFATQAARKEVLSQVAHDLKDLGFRTLPASGLKPKHVVALVTHWQAQGLAVATMKNRMSYIRWWAGKVGKQNCVPRRNSQLGIGQRKFVTNISKALILPLEDIEKISDDRIRCSVLLQREFGLRREECIKFQAIFALEGKSVSEATEIRLMESWCKGGRERYVPITSDSQREVLAKAVVLCGLGSMIPPELTYVKHLGRYIRQTRKAGICKLHGLRHEYAQKRYRDLTGWPAPAAGGPVASQLTPQQRLRDRAVRLAISAELGHNRESITAVYLGR